MAGYGFRGQADFDFLRAPVSPIDDLEPDRLMALAICVRIDCELHSGLVEPIQDRGSGQEDNHYLKQRVQRGRDETRNFAPECIWSNNQGCEENAYSCEDELIGQTPAVEPISVENPAEFQPMSSATIQRYLRSGVSREYPARTMSRELHRTRLHRV